MQQPDKNDIPEVLWQGYEGYWTSALHARLHLILYYAQIIIHLLYMRIIEDLENRVADLYHNDAIIP